jgi:hypothetical protein
MSVLSCILIKRKTSLMHVDESNLILFQGGTAQTARDIKVNFIPNESLSKTGFSSITGHS